MCIQRRSEATSIRARKVRGFVGSSPSFAWSRGQETAIRQLVESTRCIRRAADQSWPAVANLSL